MLPNYFLSWGSHRASSDDEGLWIFSDAAAAATLSCFSWAGGNSAILRGTGKMILLAAVVFCSLCYFEMHRRQKERNGDDVKGLPPARSKQIGTEAILTHKRFAKRAG